MVQRAGWNGVGLNGYGTRLGRICLCLPMCTCACMCMCVLMLSMVRFSVRDHIKYIFMTMIPCFCFHVMNWPLLPMENCHIKKYKMLLLLLELGWAMVKWEVRGRFSVLLLAIGRYMNNDCKNTYNINGQL